MPQTPPQGGPGAFSKILSLATASLVPALAIFAVERWRSEQWELFSITVFAAALAVLGAYGAWRQDRWAGWAIFSSLSWTATTGFWGVCDAHLPPWWAAIALSVVVYILAMMAPAPRLLQITWSVKVFCATVLMLTGYVTFWGLFFPKGLGVEVPGMAQGFNDGMPFVPEIPPLHARFIGSLYLGASVICLLHIFARRWSMAWILQALIFLWTFILLIVTLRHLDAFKWNVTSIWFWFIAYLAFPALASWIWSRLEVEPSRDAAAHPPLVRGWLWLQGLILMALSLVGFFAAPMLMGIWPWKLPEILSHIYSAPFATFGIGSILAARLYGIRRRATASYCITMIAVTLGALAASLMHRDKFTVGQINTAVWFAVLGWMTIANLFVAIRTLVCVAGSDADLPAKPAGV